MQFKRLITAVDAHTAGMYARVVTGGVPVIPGAEGQPSMKLKFFMNRQGIYLQYVRFLQHVRLKCYA
jgi:proline racemase